MLPAAASPADQNLPISALLPQGKGRKFPSSALVFQFLLLSNEQIIVLSNKGRFFKRELTTFN